MSVMKSNVYMIYTLKTLSNVYIIYTLKTLSGRVKVMHVGV